jgi:hypothetical protein
MQHKADFLNKFFHDIPFDTQLWRLGVDFIKILVAAG